MRKFWNPRAAAQTFGVWLTALALLLGAWSCTGTDSSNNPATMPGTAGSTGNQVVCQPGLTACGAACVNLQAESSHCGACGTACTAPSVCASGKCSTVCAAGFQKCGETCVNPANDAANCGGCGMACAGGLPCNGGVCGCPEGVVFCQGQCLDTGSDAANCGSCGTACQGGAVCASGACQCRAGEQLCGTDCSNLNSPQHCGACNKACAAGQICALGTCADAAQPCPGGSTRCGDACVNLQASARDCGACGVSCPGSQTCTAGVCGCAVGQTACGGTCADTSSSALNCGTCGKSCSSGQTCQAGQCKCAATTDVVCDGACTDPKTDINHCGDCATKCSGGLPCTEGKCACPTGQTLCDGACVSTDTTAAHCGACGMACPMGETCQAGKCSGAVGDGCTGTLAVGLSITDISVYQAGKVQIMKENAAVPKDDRAADIIQGKAGAMRVFVKLESGWANRTVSARLRLANGELKTSYFSKRNVNAASMESSLATTFNFELKAEDITADTRYAVELVECDGTPAGMAGKARFPAADNLPLETRKTGTIKLRFIPLNANGRTAASDTARLDGYKNYLALMYPTSGVEYTLGPALKVNQTVSAQGDGWSEALDQLSNLHESDNAAADVYYYGLFQPTDSIGQYCGGGCVAGIGFVTNTQSFARHQRVALGLSFANLASAQTFAHEVGHNHGRPHAPCGGAAQADPSYPYAGAKIGWWGFEAPEKLHNPATDTDIMGYCNNQWVSDYTYGLFADRIAILNGSQKELPPPGDPEHFLFLLTDHRGPRWGLDRPDPRYPSGSPEPASVLNDNGQVVATVTVYRTPMDHLGGALLLVPDPQPGWHAVQIQGEVPLAFGAKSSSR